MKKVLIPKFVEKAANRVDPRIVAALFKAAKKVPVLRSRLEKEYSGVMEDLGHAIRPYRDKVASYRQLPSQGRAREEILKELTDLAALEESRWKDGYVSGAVYHGDRAHIDFLDRVYAIHSQTNPLHSDVWPSASKFEAEIIAMTAGMLGAGAAAGGDAEDRICGAVTSGGTESILLAMKCYRDRARARQGIRRPEIVLPVTAHTAFEKAGQYFNIKLRRIPVGSDCRADVGAAKRAINRNTVALVGSAPAFPHGIVDPIRELSELARKRGIGFHTDACLGGFVLPWAEKLGREVPPFDFRLPGVTSMSADTHKYGYAPKGTSVVLYRGTDLRHFQYFKATDWPGGMYFSPTMSGSRSGALIAGCWAALVSMGENGYLEATRAILGTADKIKEGIRSIPELKLLGDPIWIVAFASDSLDVYRVVDFMTRRGWNLNGLHKPPCVHIAITLRHTQPGVAERFVNDLREAVAHVKAHPAEEGGMAPVYGLAASIPVRGVIGDILERYMDALYEV